MSKINRIFLVAIIIVGLPFILIFIIRMNTEAIAVLIGVLLGSILTGYFQIMNTIMEQRNQLRIIDVSKRLSVLQEGYSLWRRLVTDRASNIDKCMEWWENNCLYLPEHIRKEYFQSIFAASNHNALLSAHVSVEQINTNWDKITCVGESLVKAANLPPINEVDVTIKQNK